MRAAADCRWWTRIKWNTPRDSTILNVYIASCLTRSAVKDRYRSLWFDGWLLTAQRYSTLQVTSGGSTFYFIIWKKRCKNEIISLISMIHEYKLNYYAIVKNKLHSSVSTFSVESHAINSMSYVYSGSKCLF